jgi:hypothetical protein
MGKGSLYNPAPWVSREFLLISDGVQIATLNNLLAFDLQTPIFFPNVYPLSSHGRVLSAKLYLVREPY